MFKRKRNGAPSAFRQKLQRVMQNRAPVRALRVAPRQAIMAGRRRQLLNMATVGLLGVEKKFLDTGKTATAFVAPTDSTGGELDPSTGCTGCVSAPAQGDAATNRDGKQIIAKYLEIKGVINLPNQVNQGGSRGGIVAMVAVVLDTQTNGAQLNSEDVYTNTAATAIGAPVATRNLLFGPRFKVLKQEFWELAYDGTTYDGANVEMNGKQREFTWFIPLGNLKINFNGGTTADVANVIDNSIHVVGFATEATPTLTYNCRMRFIG